MSALNISDNDFVPYLNTGTPFDMISGAFTPGAKGELILNGGLAGTNAFNGRPKLFKSTKALSLIMNALAIYPTAEALVHDTERSLQKPRVLKLANSTMLNPVNLEDRLRITDQRTMGAEALYTLINQLCDEKGKHVKDYTVESPFLDPKTGKPLLIMTPTIIGVDSFSELASAAVQAIYDKSDDIGTSDKNMEFMKDGIIKKRFMSHLPALSARYGIYFVLTAHIGSKIMEDPYAPNPKELQHMRQGEKIKGVGSAYNFICSNILEMRVAKLLQDNDKNCQYPDQYSSDTELSLVTSILSSCKNNGSGTQSQNIISQQQGYLPDLTRYHYLKENDYYGLVGSKQSHSPILRPDVTLTRTTVRDKLLDYKTARALEIITQLHFIQNNWSMRDSPINFMLKLTDFAEKLTNNSSYAIDDILESRGYWTYDKTNPRSYLSLFDIIQMISGNYKPKLLSANGK
jgi:hypothetical protein